MGRLRGCPGPRETGNKKNLGCGSALASSSSPAEKSRERAVGEALTPRNTGTAKNFAFLQIIRTWLIS